MSEGVAGKVCANLKPNLKGGVARGKNIAGVLGTKACQLQGDPAREAVKSAVRASRLRPESEVWQRWVTLIGS